MINELGAERDHVAWASKLWCAVSVIIGGVIVVAMPAFIGICVGETSLAAVDPDNPTYLVSCVSSTKARRRRQVILLHMRGSIHVHTHEA